MEARGFIHVSFTAIQARTLVIVGTRDMILESHTRLIAECIPDSQLVFINGSHFIANKNPEEFNRAVLKFLNKSAKNEK